MPLTAIRSSASRLRSRIRPALLSGGAAAALLLASPVTSACAGQPVGQTAGPTTRAASDTAGRPARPVTAATPNATRAELTAALQVAERAAGGGRDGRSGAEASAIRTRLRDGDFRTGDRIGMSVPGDTNAREIPVREGPLVELAPGIPALSLAGVLRSELTPLVLSHLAKYIREPDVRVWMLQRVGIFGAVGRPGVYWVPRDVVLSELPMRAGGLTAGARLDKARVVRDGREVVNAKTFARLSRDGRTVDEAGLRAGDEIRVPERAQRNWAQVATYAFFGISALTALLALVRSSYQ